MQGRILAALCAGFAVGCAGPAQLPASPPPAVEQAASDRAADLVTVDLVALAASQRDVVCRERTRPGSRIVIGEKCRLRSQTGVTAETLRELDRELTGRGYAPGWKTEGQIDAEGALGAY